MPKEKVIELDIRPLLAEGRMPLYAVLEAFENLEKGEMLRLTAPMEPTPIYERAAASSLDYSIVEKNNEFCIIEFRFPADECP